MPSPKATNNNRYRVRARSRYGTPFNVGAAPNYAKAKRIAYTHWRMTGEWPSIFNGERKCES